MERMLLMFSLLRISFHCGRDLGHLYVGFDVTVIEKDKFLKRFESFLARFAWNFEPEGAEAHKKGR